MASPEVISITNTIAKTKLQSLRANSRFTDITFVCAGNEWVHAHRAVVCEYSSYVLMLSESGGKNVVIDLSKLGLDVRKELMSLTVDFMYGMDLTIALSDLSTLMVLANRLNMLEFISAIDCAISSPTPSEPHEQTQWQTNETVTTADQTNIKIEAKDVDFNEQYEYGMETTDTTDVNMDNYQHLNSLLSTPKEALDLPAKVETIERLKQSVTPPVTNKRKRVQPRQIVEAPLQESRSGRKIKPVPRMDQDDVDDDDDDEGAIAMGSDADETDEYDPLDDVNADESYEPDKKPDIKKLKINLKDIKPKKPRKTRIKKPKLEAPPLTAEQKKLKKYVCSECDPEVRFSTCAKRRRHYSQVHGLFGCRKCSDKFQSQEALDQHILTHGVWQEYDDKMKETDDDRWFNCDACSVRCDTRAVLKQHMNIVHNVDNPYHCTACRMWFVTENAYFDHRNNRLSCHSRKNRGNSLAIVTCKQCGKTMKAPQLKNHMKLHTCKEEDIEHDVDKYFAKKIEVEVDGEMTERYQCHYCDNIYDSEATANNHLHRHINLFICKICKMTFISFALWRVHGNVHGDPKYICHICGSQFKHRSQLTSHKEIHIAPIVCELCGKHFKTKPNLLNHKRGVHEQTTERFQCDQCPQIFHLKNRLNRHVLSHSKPFHCTYCDQRFGYKKYLIQHVRIHTGEKPYKCSTCGVGFRQKNSLNVHNKSHHSNLEKRQFSSNDSF
ncbi:unnamed protein product [Owenia fusiformis]|uniref:Uncharacterized protein n=1 Tax=Owenia fusiformis TaxID=6347 RepID=A0A8S4PJ27_OWEFU|nr:unnamed protein product [Owenia fusiformis]